MRPVTVVGGGLAGCEAAWQLAERGIDVTILEQKPKKRTPAQTGDGLAELVCSNSMRGAALSNAVGLLKEELRRAGSLVMRVADGLAGQFDHRRRAVDRGDTNVRTSIREPQHHVAGAAADVDDVA